MSFIPWWVHYPNVNNEILNLDWLLKVSNCNTHKIENFINLNTIKYADPILWDITSQYEANTVVVDGQTGNAYISTKAVPSGVHLNRTEYWTQIYNYSDVIDTLEEQIAAANEGQSTTASAPRAISDLVWLNGLLYRVTAPMIAGDSYVVNSNCVKTTIEDELDRLKDADAQLQDNIDAEADARANADDHLQDNIDAEADARADADTQLQNNIGALSDLNTSNKTSIVNAVNEVNSKVGPLSDLATTTQTNIVNAINSINLQNNDHYKNILLFSDSYGTSDNDGGWCKKCKGLLEQYNSNYHADYSALSGYGFIGNDGTFLSLITAKANTMTDTEKRSITDLVIGGGWNDTDHTQSDMYVAIYNCISYCKTTFPNARIWVAFMGFDTQYSILNKLMGDTYNYYKKASTFFGARHMDNVAFIVHNLAYMSDTRHPTANGYENIAYVVAQYLITGNANADLPRTPMSIVYNGNIVGPTNAYQYLHNETVDVFIAGGTFVNTGSTMSMQFDGAHPYELGSVKGCIVGDPVPSAGVTIPCVFNVGGTLYYGNANIYIQDCKLYIKPFYINGLGSGAPNNVSTVYFDTIRFTHNARIS